MARFGGPFLKNPTNPSEEGVWSGSGIASAVTSLATGYESGKAAPGLVFSHCFPTAFTAAAINTQLTAIASAKATLHLIPGTWTIDAAVTVPANVHLVIEVGAVLTKSGSGTVAINGPLTAPLIQVFSGFTSGVSIGGGHVDCVFPQWWGASADGLADDAGAIQAAISAAGAGTVFFPVGTYRVASSLSLTNHYTTFEGVGSGGSVIKADASVKAFAVPGGDGQIGRHGLRFRRLMIQGQAATTPAEFAITVPAPTAPITKMEFGALFDDVEFNNIKVFDCSGKAVEMTGCKFEAVQFNNAPIALSSTEASNTICFDRCRWSGITAALPACSLYGESISLEGFLFRFCVFESIARQAVRIQNAYAVTFDSCYWENCNTAAGDYPYVDCCTSAHTINFKGSCYVNATGGDEFLGSSDAGVTSIPAVLFDGLFLAAGTIDSTLLPDVVYLHDNAAGGASSASFKWPIKASGGIVGTATSSGTAIANKVGNATSLSTTGDKIVSWYNDNLSTEKAYINKDGKGYFAGGLLLGDALTSNGTVYANEVIGQSASVATGLVGTATDGASAVACRSSNAETLTNATAKIHAFYAGWRSSEAARIYASGRGSFDGGVSVLHVGALPAAGATYRDTLAAVAGGTGVPDRLYVCLKDADGSYNWRPASTPNVAAAAPTTGTWVVGDIVYNSSPSAGGSVGWVCVDATGSGTWKEFGPISL